jgi:hypothetical protein
MAEQPNQLRSINWEETFSFPRIFRSFKMAIHPSKLILALAGLVLMGLWGWALDGLWVDNAKPVGNEINAFWQVGDLDAWREKAREKRLVVLQDIYGELGLSSDNLKETLAYDPGRAIERALERVESQYEDKAEELEDDDEKLAELGREYNHGYRNIVELRNRGLFTSFLSFETTAIRQMIDAATNLNFWGGYNQVFRGRYGQSSPPGPFEKTEIKTGPEGYGVFPSIMLMIRGEQWLATQHPFFYILFALGTLAIWALFGGAICRMAALNFARDERIAPKAALSFAGRKFLGFFTAPLLPVAIIILVGVFLFLGGLIGAIPGIGELIAGALMFLALIGGFVMALVLIGLAFGGVLLLPAIAVEGSDAFDAVSRSYSYVFSRPWRTGLYYAVLAVYGAICYLFARLVVFLLLKLTHGAVEMGMAAAGNRPGVGSVSASKLDAMWPSPTFDNLLQAVPTFGMHGAEPVGAFLIRIWLVIIVLLLCGFLVSLYLSGATIIYYLLRQKVDATDFEEVYQEEELEEGEGPAEGEAAPSGGQPAPAPGGESGTGTESPQTGESSENQGGASSGDTEEKFE